MAWYNLLACYIARNITLAISSVIQTCYHMKHLLWFKATYQLHGTCIKRESTKIIGTQLSAPK